MKFGGPSSSLKPTPLSAWENSHEFNKIGEVISRNRKLLIDNFRRESTTTANVEVTTSKPIKGALEPVKKTETIYYVTFPQAKKALADLLYQEFTKVKNGPKLSDEKIKLVMQPGLLPDPTKERTEALYDFMKVLDLFKKRHKSYV